MCAIHKMCEMAIKNVVGGMDSDKQFIFVFTVFIVVLNRFYKKFKKHKLAFDEKMCDSTKLSCRQK